MPKKIPMRMCVGCRQMVEKRSLVRIVRTGEGVVSLDRTGKAAGRGAYICKNTECLDRAIKVRGLERAFGAAMEKSVYEQLKEELSACDE